VQLQITAFYFFINVLPSQKGIGNFYHRVLLAKDIFYLKVMNPVIQIA